MKNIVFASCIFIIFVIPRQIRSEYVSREETMGESAGLLTGKLENVWKKTTANLWRKDTVDDLKENIFEEPMTPDTMKEGNADEWKEEALNLSRKETPDNLMEETKNISKEETMISLAEETPDDLEEAIADARKREAVDLLEKEAAVVSVKEILNALKKCAAAELKKKQTRVTMNSTHYYLEGEKGRKHRVPLFGSVSANILMLENVNKVSKSMRRRISQMIDIEVLYLIKCTALIPSLPTVENLKSLKELIFSEYYGGGNLDVDLPAQLEINSIEKLTIWRVSGRLFCLKTIKKLIRNNQLKQIRVSDSLLLEKFFYVAGSECIKSQYKEIAFLYGSNRYTCDTINWYIEANQLYVKITDIIAFDPVLLDYLKFDLIAVNLRANLVNSVASWMSYFESLGEKITTLILEGFVDMRCRPPLADAATAMAHYSQILKKLTKLHTLQLEIIPSESVLSADELKKVCANMQKLIANSQERIDRIIFVRKDQLAFQIQEGLKIDEVCGKWYPVMHENHLKCIRPKNRLQLL